MQEGQRENSELVACVVFAAEAWRCPEKDRDEWIFTLLAASTQASRPLHMPSTNSWEMFFFIVELHEGEGGGRGIPSAHHTRKRRHVLHAGAVVTLM